MCLGKSDYENMEKNAAYPAWLQPRNRENAAYRLQVNKIANNLKPELLGENLMVGFGAPIVGADMAVEIGNGWTIAPYYRQMLAASFLVVLAFQNAGIRESCNKQWTAFPLGTIIST